MKPCFRERPWLAATFFLFTVLCWQVFWWRHQAVPITVMQVKSFLHLLKAHEYLEWGALCNGLKDFECAATAFGHLSKSQPKNRVALSNYAIALAQASECGEALLEFDRYRRGGPEGPEALFWRGQCHLQQKQIEPAKKSFYMSTALSADATQAPEALVDLLMQQGLSTEAFSVIAALTSGKPSHSERWRQKFAEMVEQEPLRHEARAIRLPNLDGQNFWVPVRYSADTSMDFVTLDPQSPEMTLNQDQWRQRRPANFDGDRLEFPHLQLGPWMFEDLEFSLCQSCTSVVGRSILDRFEISEDHAASLRFMVLMPN